MPDLVGQVTLRRELDDGLVLERVSCPLGLLGVVFESRPDALVQIVGLAWKSGNAVLLKGGREALATNRALTAIIHRVLEDAGIDPRAAVLLEGRDDVTAVLALHGIVEVIVARGSSEFVRQIQESSEIPVMGHAAGVCHLYVHAGRRSGDGRPAGRRRQDHLRRGLQRHGDAALGRLGRRGARRLRRRR